MVNIFCQCTVEGHVFMNITSKILLLNNKPELAKALQAYLLHKEGFEHIDCIHEPGEAFSRLARNEYELLVLSNHLSTMKGIDFVRWLRDEAVQVPFVMIAGDSDISQAVEAMKAGAVEFLQWSDDIGALFPYIAEVLRKDLHQNSKRKLFSENELLYKTLFDNIRDAVFVHFVDENTWQPETFIEVNEVAARRLRYTRHELSHMTPFDIDLVGQVDMKSILETLFAKGSVIFNTVHVTKDKQHIPVEINAMLLNLKNRKAILSVARNITDQQKTLKDLQNSESRFRSIIEKCIIGICITNHNGYIEYVNDEYCKIYSYTPEEMLGKHFTMVVPLENRQMSSDLHDEFIENGRTMRDNWVVVDKHDNKKFVVADAARIIDAAGKYKKVTFVEDITKEKQAKEALELSEMKYRTMMENLQDPIFISDKDYNIAYTNKVFKKRFGEVKKDAKCYRQIFGEESPCPWCTRAIDSMTRIRKRVEKTINKRVYQITTIPIEIERLYQAKMTILRDVTKVVKARRKAEESDKLKSAFLANISHEIRTPLNVVLGFANLLKDENITRDEMLMYVDMINESSSHLLHVIDNIMEFSFVDSGLVQIEAKKIDPDDLMEDLRRDVAQMQRKIEKKGLQITFQNQLPANTEILTDAKRLHQILQNLLSNALKFTEIGGIQLTVYHDENKWVVFSVKDTGIGIRPDKHAIIFRRFRQADEGNSRMFGGNGLGLALSKHLAQMLGGNIKLESEPGKGSNFQLFIPEKLDESLVRALSSNFVK
jgi:PAS domain S-box-containing protein